MDSRKKSQFGWSLDFGGVWSCCENPKIQMEFQICNSDSNSFQSKIGNPMLDVPVHDMKTHSEIGRGGKKKGELTPHPSSPPDTTNTTSVTLGNTLIELDEGAHATEATRKKHAAASESAVVV